MFDVGQLISTPKGVACVLSIRRDGSAVSTDLGMFTVENLAPVLDVEAITASPESLEAWLEAPEEHAPTSRVTGASEPCRCRCGQQGQCHHLVHLDIEDRVVWRSMHAPITTRCDCLPKDCPCTH